MVSVMSAIAFGLVYLFTEALEIIYVSYGFTVQEASLAFVPLGIGFLLGTFTRFYDSKIMAKRRLSNKPLLPENKLTGFTIAVPALAIGLWCFSWTIPPLVHIHWSLSLLTLIPIGFAINDIECVLAGYLADSYTIYAASAFASLSILRSIFSAVFPLFARQMFTKLGPNYALSVLASIATVACLNPIIFLKYGKRIRQASKFARHSLEVHDANLVLGTSSAEGTALRDIGDPEHQH